MPNSRYVLRKLLKLDLFDHTHLLGLSTAICAATIIFLFVRSEVYTDKQFAQAGDIYRIVRTVEEPNDSYQSPSLAGPFDKMIGEATGIGAEDILRIYRDDELISYEDKKFFETNVLYVDGNFLSVFDFDLEMGKPADALSKPNSAVISRNVAKKYFGDSNPIGETLEVEGKSMVVVTGVLSATDEKSHLKIDFLVKNDAMGYTSRILSDTKSHAFTFYLRIPQDRTEFVLHSLNKFSQLHLNQDGTSRSSLSLQPLQDIYFDKPMRFDTAEHNDWAMIETLVTIASILLLIVSANIVNLFIAQLSSEAKQIGIKKVLGSSRRALIMDWISEVYLKIFLATALGVLISCLALPYLSSSYQLVVTLPSSYLLVLTVVAFPVVMTLFIVAIPASMFSSLNAYTALSGKIGNLKGYFVQHALLGFQFTVAFVFIVLAIVIVSQFQYMQAKEIGLDDQHVLVFNSNNKHSWQNREYIRNEVMAISGVEDVSMLYGGVPDSPTEALSYLVDGNTYQWNTAFVQPNLINLLDIELIEGQTFTERQTKNEVEVILNESASKALGWPNQELVGKYITSDESTKPLRVLGIVQDYHYESFKNKIEPLVIQSSGGAETFVVKLAGNDYTSVLDQVEDVWNTYVPAYPFAYYFLDDSFQKMHIADAKNREVIFLFTILTIIIASMGTLSMGALVQQSKIKEITIRKVLGAPLLNVFYTLSSSFVNAFLLATFIAVPTAWILSRYWLSDFSYRIRLTPSYFIIGFVSLAIVISAVVVVQAWKTATGNPIKRLAFE